jgi:hypothetical protein
MRWNWDFIRNRRTEIQVDQIGLRSNPLPAGLKVIVVNGHAHEIQEPHLSDMQVAGQVRMLERMQLDHERVCTLARDRIVYLADRLGEIEANAALPVSEADITAGAAAIVDDWSGGDTSWRARLDDSDFLESADWLKAVDLSRAVLTATRGAR